MEEKEGLARQVCVCNWPRLRCVRQEVTDVARCVYVRLTKSAWAKRNCGCRRSLLWKWGSLHHVELNSGQTCIQLYWVWVRALRANTVTVLFLLSRFLYSCQNITVYLRNPYGNCLKLQYVYFQGDIWRDAGCKLVQLFLYSKTQLYLYLIWEKCNFCLSCVRQR